MLMLLGSRCEELLGWPYVVQMQCVGAECGHMVFYLPLLDESVNEKQRY
jgi:hypothetical protein